MSRQEAVYLLLELNTELGLDMLREGNPCHKYTLLLSYIHTPAVKFDYKTMFLLIAGFVGWNTNRNNWRDLRLQVTTIVLPFSSIVVLLISQYKHVFMAIHFITQWKLLQWVHNNGMASF